MSIEGIDKQLQMYYTSLQAPYDRLFAEYCDENGIDDETLADEIDEGPEECILVDFDPDFPFPKQRKPKNKAERNNKILNLIKKCFQSKALSFSVSMPDFNAELFTVTDIELNAVKRIYAEQCPVLWDAGMENDQSFLRILAIGRKHNFDYLQHLVDDYFRGRVENIESNFTVVEWAQKNKHLKALSNFPKTKGSKHTPYELALGSVKAFGSRCCPKLLFSNIIEIDDSLEICVKYIVAAVNFISGLLKQENMCPFQVDLCLGFGAPIKQESVMSVTDTFEEDDDDEDEDDDDIDEKDGKSGDFFDCIGDINGKLAKNKLTFQVAQNDANDDTEVQSRTFGLIFNAFKNKLDKSNKGFPQRRRFVTFVDRRGGTRPKPRAKLEDDEKYDVSKDDIWMYEPPANCSNIPSDAVPEWYISASRTCLLPNMDYGDGKEAEATGNHQGDGTSITQEKLQKANIGSSSHCKGSLLTLSFICKEQDAMKAYLYWNGQILRFIPEDIRDVLPKLWNMEWNDGEEIAKDTKSKNEQFIENTKEIDNLIKILNEKMCDKHFRSFQQSCY